MAKQSVSAEAPAKAKKILVDEAEFVRTRDALITSLTSLDGAIQNAVHAYIDHSNTVLSGKKALDHSMLNVLGNAITTAANGLPDAAVKDEAGPDDKKKRKRVVKPKDPNAPKRPLTAYLLYLEDMRPTIQQELGDVQKRGDISAEGTRRWHKLNKEEQQKFKDRYNQSYQEYKKELAKYKAEGGEVPPEAEHPEEDIDEVEADLDAEAEPDTEAEPVTTGVAAKNADIEETSSESSSSSDDSSDEEATPPKEPTPPPVKTPRAGRSRKAAAAAAVVPASSPPIVATSSPSKSRKSAAVDGAVKETSPVLKRKADSPEETRSRKTRKETAAVVETPKAAESTPAKKGKKEKKARKSIGADA